MANSSLVFVDPDGEKIEFVGNKSQIIQIKSALRIVSKTSAYGRDIVKGLKKSKNVHKIIVMPDYPTRGMVSSSDIKSALKKGIRSKKYSLEDWEGAIELREEYEAKRDNGEISGILMEEALDAAYAGSGTSGFVIGDAQDNRWKGIKDNRDVDYTGNGSKMFLSQSFFKNGTLNLGSFLHEIGHMFQNEKGVKDEMSLWGGIKNTVARLVNEVGADEIASEILYQMSEALKNKKKISQKKAFRNLIRDTKFHEKHSHGGYSFSSSDVRRYFKLRSRLHKHKKKN